MTLSALLATSIRSASIDASIPVYRFGHRAGRMTVYVRAQYDQALGMTADIWAEDDSENLHPLPQSIIPDILAEIETEDETAWRDIVAASGREAA